MKLSGYINVIRQIGDWKKGVTRQEPIHKIKLRVLCAFELFCPINQFHSIGRCIKKPFCGSFKKLFPNPSLRACHFKILG
jgi:hypothetical protein